MAAAQSRNITVNNASRPRLPRHAKLKFDETRQRWVILAPERVLAPDEIAVEVLQLCDGVRSVDQMIDQLAEKYAAERDAIGTDVIAMLQDLADKGFLTEAREKTS
jgi:pyrroloquinoline quinone biosynthesis protein D